jgi:hypothetical protein
VFENRVLRKIFRPKRNTVTGGWRTLHNKDLRDLSRRRMRWAGHLARMWEKRNTYRLLVRKPEGQNH